MYIKLHNFIVGIHIPSFKLDFSWPKGGLLNSLERAKPLSHIRTLYIHLSEIYRMSTKHILPFIIFAKSLTRGIKHINKFSHSSRMI